MSPQPLAVGRRFSSQDYDSRPHYELFRHPPALEFQKTPRFLSDRMLEETFEAVRKRVAPRAPSRETAFFAFICRECAIRFRDRSRKGGIIVSVSPVSGSLIFVADLIWRNVAANVLLEDDWHDPSSPFKADTQRDALQKVAEAYWRGDRPQPGELASFPEALIEGEVVVQGSS